MARRVVVIVVLSAIAVAMMLALLAMAGAPNGRVGDALVCTALVLAAASVFCIAIASGWNHARARGLARACAVVTGVAVALMLAAIWRVVTEKQVDELMAISCATAVALAHATMLVKVTLPPRLVWMRGAMLGCNAVIVLALALALAQKGHASDVLLTVPALVSVVDAALTLAILVAGTFAGAVARRTADGAPVVVCFCPGCGQRLWFPAGEIRCEHCRNAYTVHPVVVGELAAARLV